VIKMKNRTMLFALMLLIAISSSYEGPAQATELSKEQESIKSLQNVSPLSGKVIETMNSGGYTYVNIEREGKKTWIAVPQMEVTVGQEMSFEPGATMNNFRSKSLNRMFDTIIFSSGAIGQKGTLSDQKSVSNKQTMATQEEKIKVEKAPGSDAYTVAGLYEKSAELDNKKVIVRGKVVKVSPNIMGKNWIHIQDGSGNPSSGTNDIIVTSQDLPSVGDIVTATGTFYKDKDFGSGYRYSAIVEQANIKR
jgi:hypothetical protein